MNIQAIARTRIPNASLKLLLRLAKTLVGDLAIVDDPLIQAHRAQIIEQIETIDAALAARLRSHNPRLLAGELEFDRATDAAWVFVRKLLELLASVHGHPGLELLSPERQAKVELPKLRELAVAAAALNNRLFGASGTAFTQSPFPLQAESMATILRIIDEDQLEPALASLLGSHIVPLLRACQAQYEEIVDLRLRRESGVREDFRALRGELRWRLDRYKTAVELLYDPSKPETLELIRSSLRPLLLLSAQMTRAPGQLDEELDHALAPAELFDALEQAGDEPTDDEQAAE